MAEGAEVAKAFVTLIPSFKGGKKAIEKELSGAAGGAGEKAGATAGKRFGSSFIAPIKGMVGPLAAAIAGAGVVNFVKDVIGSASDLNETLSKSQQIFGPAFKELDKWASKSATTVGLSREGALAYAATLGDMFRQLGFNRKEVVKNSTAVVQLAADLGSFHNLGTEDVLQRIQAAFRGEYDSLQALIPNINAARVETQALAMTGKDNAKKLTAQEKAAATLAILYKDAGPAIGDFARTSGSLANQQKILSAQWADAKAQLGQGLLPIATKVVSQFNKWLPTINKVAGQVADFLTPAIEQAAKFVAALFTGFQGGSGPVSKIMGILRALAPIVGQVVAFVKQLTPAFDQVGKAVGKLVSALLPIVQRFAQQLTKTLGPGLKAIAALITTQLAPSLSKFLAVITPVVKFVVKFLLEGLIGALRGAIQFIQGALTIITGILNIFIGVFTGNWSKAWEGVKQIFSGAWTAIVGAFKVFINVGIGKTFGLAGKLLKGIAGKIWGPIGGVFSKAWGGLKGVVKSGVDAISKLVKGLLDWLKKALGTVGNIIAAPFRLAWAAVKAVTNSVWSAIKTIISAAIKWVASLIKGQLNAIKSTFSAVWNAARTVVNAAWSGIKSVTSGGAKAVANAVRSAWNTVKRATTSAWNGIKSAVQKAINSVVSLARGIGGKIKSAVGNLGGILRGAGKAVIQGLINGVQDMIGALKRKLKSVTDMIPDLKGPMPVDLRLLEPSGEAIMSGLIRGIDRKTRELRSTLVGITRDIPGMAGPGLDLASLKTSNRAGAAGAGTNIQTMHVEISAKDVDEMRSVAEFFERVQQEARRMNPNMRARRV